MKRLSLIAALLVTQAGCFIYFDGSGDGDDCYYDDDGLAEPFFDNRRNPETGMCESVGGGGGGGGGCWGEDEPRPLPAEGPTTGGGSTGSGEVAGDALEAPAIELDWATCSSFCDSLDELSCQATDGCRAIYVESCPECDDISPPVFAACWGTAPSGPVHGECAGLDAYQCSRHDDCVAVHDDFIPDCDMGKPGARCSIAPNTPGQFLWCQNEAAQPEGCYSDMDCQPGYECTSDTECLPAPGCGAMDPACPPVCYGRCVPATMDKPCAELGSELECITRNDCRPLYQGSDCSCNEMGCWCQTQTYLTCADGMGTDPGTTCGPYVCSGAEYCEHMIGGAPPPDGMTPWESYACKPLPSACLAGMWSSFCECLKDEPCGQICEVDAAGQATLTCALP